MKLKQYLIETKTTVKDFAERIKVSKAYVYFLLKGQIPSLHVCVKIEAETGCQVTRWDFYGQPATPLI